MCELKAIWSQVFWNYAQIRFEAMCKQGMGYSHSIWRNNPDTETESGESLESSTSKENMEQVAGAQRHTRETTLTKYTWSTT